MKEREVNIITHGSFDMMEMSESEKAAFMATLLARLLETTSKNERRDLHAT